MTKTKTGPILLSRLVAQHLAFPPRHTATEVVSHMGALQAQEFAMAKWAIGLRSNALHEIDVDKAFHAGKIIRTHVLRPTWHFVAPEDLRWIIQLTAPRVHQANAFMYRQCELTPALFKRSDKIIAAALEGGKHLTREELQTELARKKIVAESFRLGYLMMHAELERLICSGPRSGNQFTYALIDERVPAQKKISTTEALRKLTLRFFTSRGPATAEDFKYWSALTMKEVNRGLELCQSELQHEIIEHTTYYFHDTITSLPAHAQTTFLLPDYDEFGMSYKNKKEIIHPQFNGTYNYNRMFAVDGLIAGSWKRTLSGKKVTLEILKNVKLNKKQDVALAQAARKFAAFIDKEADINVANSVF